MMVSRLYDVLSIDLRWMLFMEIEDENSNNKLYR